MILSNITRIEEIANIHPRMTQLINFIRSRNIAELPIGRNEIDGNNIFINHDIVEGRTRQEQLLEVHRKYIDLHILISEHETIGIKPTESIKVFSTEYDNERDLAFSPEPANEYYELSKGDILVAFPEDAHAPIINNGKIEKLIAKIRI